MSERLRVLNLIKGLGPGGAERLLVSGARVRDVLRVKYWLGLFDQPYVADPAATDKIVRAPAHLAVADRAAHESIVLLKKAAGILPLKKDGLKKILVAGPLVGWIVSALEGAILAGGLVFFQRVENTFADVI